MIKSIVLIVLLSVGVIQAQDLLPKEIIEKIDNAERVGSSEANLKQIIITSKGKKRILEVKVYSKDQNEKQLMIYTNPARVKGDKILMLNDGDDIWFYTPKTDRIRHLASHAKRQKIQGSEFSYEDMAGGNIEEDYTYKLLGEEKIDKVKCYKLELIPTKTGPNYSKLILWADKEKYLTRRIDYYKKGELFKRLRLYDIDEKVGHWYMKKIEMENLQSGGKTIIETGDITFDLELSDKMFTTNSLKSRITKESSEEMRSE